MCAGRADGTVGVTCSSKRSLPTYPVAFASRFSSSKPSCRATSVSFAHLGRSDRVGLFAQARGGAEPEEVVALPKYLRMQIEHASEFTPKPMASGK